VSVAANDPKQFRIGLRAICSSQYLVDQINAEPRRVGFVPRSRLYNIIDRRRTNDDSEESLRL
jgi:hypothetical protein